MSDERLALRERESLRAENAKLRYLCIRLIPQLQPSALMRGESPGRRLAYLVDAVTLADAEREYEASAHVRRPA